MEQKDFILREIERMGQVLNAIRQKLLGGNNRLAISVEKEVDDAKGVLFAEVELDFDKLIDLNKEETADYLNGFKGFNAANIELFADYMAQIGFNTKSDKSRIYLEKALYLYELTNLKSETFSFDREKRISAIRNSKSLL